MGYFNKFFFLKQLCTNFFYLSLVTELPKKNCFLYFFLFIFVFKFVYIMFFLDILKMWVVLQKKIHTKVIFVINKKVTFVNFLLFVPKSIFFCKTVF